MGPGRRPVVSRHWVALYSHDAFGSLYSNPMSKEPAISLRICFFVKTQSGRSLKLIS